ncbi:DNA-3-methyladenine glycosylase I [Enterococcus sp. LJL98]
MKRCDWGNANSLMQDYHDFEWGKETHDEQKLFEMLVLESMQAGLSWTTILNKREHFREAFDQFEIEKVANYGEEKYQALLVNSGIIRHPLKIRAAIHNAQVFLNIQKKYGSFDAYFWQFTERKVLVNHWKSLEEVPSQSLLSEEIAKQMKKEGFKFIGSTSIYSFMQAIGMINDHLTCCSFK